MCLVDADADVCASLHENQNGYRVGTSSVDNRNIDRIAECSRRGQCIRSSMKAKHTSRLALFWASSFASRRKSVISENNMAIERLEKEK